MDDLDEQLDKLGFSTITDIESRRSSGGSCRNLPIRTIGGLNPSGPAFVYVATTKNRGVKIGMTSNPALRMAPLRAKLAYARQCTVPSAKEIETRALQLLGAMTGDGEYVWVPAEKAIEAVDQAFDQLARRMNVDPTLSDEEARQRRILGLTSP